MNGNHGTPSSAQFFASLFRSQILTQVQIFQPHCCRSTLMIIMAVEEVERRDQQEQKAVECDYQKA